MNCSLQGPKHEAAELTDDTADTLQQVLDRGFNESHDSRLTDDKIIIAMVSGQVFLENH